MPAKKTERVLALDIDQVCQAILNGKTLTDIAREYEVSRSVVAEWINADPGRSARAREARQDAAAAFDEQAFDLIQQAADPFELSKAKEMAQHLRWRASKINVKEYGDKQQLDVKAEVNTLYDLDQAKKMIAWLKTDDA